ncbi:MAG: hypothetical protein QN189_12630 [Armatimonadota bacterium]|nr:hypothetical protein [Armatimonadota bacterium]
MINVEIALSMALRLWLSKSASPEARKTAGRWLAAITAAGLALTFLILALSGNLGGRWFIATVAWVVLLYLPLRIFLEASAGWGGQMKRTLAQEIRKRADRYRSPRSIALMVEWLFDWDVLMPRIAKPDHATKAREAALAIIHRAMQTGNPRRSSTVGQPSASGW